MAKAVFQTVIQDAEGDSVSGASIEIRNEVGGALATLWNDRDGTDPAGNPVVTDDNGFKRVYTDPGTYKITVTSPGASREYRHVPLFENATAPGSTPGTVTVALAAGELVDYVVAGWSAALPGTGILLVETGSGDTALASLNVGADGQVVTVHNKGPNLLTLNHEDASGTAAQRFRAGYDLSIPVGSAVRVQYSLSLSRWLVCA